MSKLTRTTQVMVLLLITLFFGTSIVAADYIGPQRTYYVEVPSSCHYTYSGSGTACEGYPSNPASCTCNIYCDTCLRSDGSCSGVSPHQIDAQCGNSGFSQTGFELITKTITRSYPIAVAGTNWTCPIPGINGWCHSPFPVQLYGVDNYADHGYYITALEGLLDGVPFFADAVDTITIQIGEGSHHLDFWALSSYGDSSNHFIENYYVDTQDPVINASLSGTPGDNNWFVSDTTLTVTFTDPVPGSGVDFTRALSNGIDFIVASPVTFTEGVYFLQLDVTDFAGHSAQTLYNLMVDTTPPAVTSNQPPVEVAVDGVAGGGYVNGSVVFTGTCSDATSGVNRIEISTGGGPLTSIAPNPDGTWTLDWDSSMLPDGTYTPVIIAVDNAGNRTDITMQPLSLDNSAPAMSITGGWYIWESGHIVTYDTRVGIERIELSVRDDQNRWPAREWDYGTQKLEMDLQWDRKFADGTIAPIGTYEVLLQAWDRLGNGRYITAHIYIPEAGATAIIPYDGMLTAGDVEPTSTPLPTQPAGELPIAAVGGSEPQPTNTPMPTSTMVAIPISGGEDNTVILSSAESSGDSAPANTTPISNGILWGAAAMAAGAAAAVVSQKQLIETRAKVEAEIWQEAMDAIAKRWEQTVAGVVAWNKAVAEAEAAHEKEVQAEKEKWLKEINDTNGDVLNDLSEEEFNELMQTNKGAYLAVTEILKQQELEQQKADEKAEQAAKTQSYYASNIAAYQASKKTAAVNDKLTKVEEQTSGSNVITPNQYATASKTEAKVVADDGNGTDGGNWLTNIGNSISSGWAFLSNLGKSDSDEDVIKQGNTVTVSQFLPNSPEALDIDNEYISQMGNPNADIDPVEIPKHLMPPYYEPGTLEWKLSRMEDETEDQNNVYRKLNIGISPPPTGWGAAVMETIENSKYVTEMGNPDFEPVEIPPELIGPYDNGNLDDHGDPIIIPPPTGGGAAAMDALEKSKYYAEMGNPNAELPEFDYPSGDNPSAFASYLEDVSERTTDSFVDSMSPFDLKEGVGGEIMDEVIEKISGKPAVATALLEVEDHFDEIKEDGITAEEIFSQEFLVPTLIGVATAVVISLIASSIVEALAIGVAGVFVAYVIGAAFQAVCDGFQVEEIAGKAINAYIDNLQNDFWWAKRSKPLDPIVNAPPIAGGEQVEQVLESAEYIKDFSNPSQYLNELIPQNNYPNGSVESKLTNMEEITADQNDIYVPLDQINNLPPTGNAEQIQDSLDKAKYYTEMGKQNPDLPNSDG